MKKLLAALALVAAPVFAGPIVTSDITFNVGTSLWHYSYTFDQGDVDANILGFFVSLPYVGTPDYLPFNIVNLPSWETVRGTCGVAGEIPAGTGCWATRRGVGLAVPNGTWEFDTGYAPVAGSVIVGIVGTNFVLADFVPNFDNSLVEDPRSEVVGGGGAAIPEPSTILLVSGALLVLARRRLSA